VLPSAPRSYTWDARPAAGKYAFSVYGPDGFLTSFAGTVVPAIQNNVPVPVVTTATLASGPPATVELTVANQGQGTILFTLTPNDYQGRPQTVTVHSASSQTVSWPANQDGYYDVVITASTGDGFRRRYAGPHRLTRVTRRRPSA
jgi:phospholipase C